MQQAPARSLVEAKRWSIAPQKSETTKAKSATRSSTVNLRLLNVSFIRHGTSDSKYEPGLYRFFRYSP